MSIIKNRCKAKKDIIDTIHEMRYVDNTTKNNLKFWCNQHRAERDYGDIIKAMAAILHSEHKITAEDYLTILDFVRKERVTLWRRLKNLLSL
jgi:hypothetical protein